jgi:uracil-DNA glycosylase
MDILMDISGYFEFLRGMGVRYPDISVKSKKIVKNLDIEDPLESKEKYVIMMERELNENLSFLSLNSRGNPSAELFFILCRKKTATDSAEIYQGEQGQLFLKILKAMHLNRYSVYVSCIVMPDIESGTILPENGDNIFAQPDINIPEKTGILPESCINRKSVLNEFDLCIDTIKKQMHIIRPRIICCLGDAVAKAFLATDLSIYDLRGKFHDYKGIRVMATFDPGTLIKEPDKKRFVWNDMQQIMAVKGL